MEETYSSTASSDDSEGINFEISKRKKKPWKRQEPLVNMHKTTTPIFE